MAETGRWLSFPAGTLSPEKAVAPLAGPPRPPGACGPGHVHPHITHQDQLPQHQADSYRVILCHPSAQYSTTEAASPSFTVFPWVLLATLTLEMQKKEGE